jgi:DNA-binding transcriptional LysR family regulator
MGPLEWSDLAIFLAVQRTGSHAGAARALRVAPTTVGRRLAALEAALGTRLFARTPDGLAPTRAARALLPRAERVEAEVRDAALELSGADARATGTVRITCGDGFGAFVLAPALPAFLAEHPGLAVEVVASVRVLDLTRGEADVAVRLFRPREKSLVAKRVGTERYALYAAPSYLARRGVPRTAKELDGHDLVIFDRDMDRLRAQAWFTRLAPNARVAVRCSTTTSLHAAVEAGAGVAILTTSAVRGNPRFVNVLPKLEAPPSEMWLVTHADLRHSARVAVAIGFLEDLVRRTEGPP